VYGWYWKGEDAIQKKRSRKKEGLSRGGNEKGADFWESAIRTSRWRQYAEKRKKTRSIREECRSLPASTEPVDKRGITLREEEGGGRYYWGPRKSNRNSAG